MDTPDFTSPPLLPSLRPPQLERLAEAAHEVWCAGKRRAGWQLGTSKSESQRTHPWLLDYARLPEEAKQANRANVLSIPEKLAAAGCTLAAANAPDASADFPGTLLEPLAELEHELWMQAKLAAGFTLGTASADTPRRNEYLLPWDDVPDTIKQADRDLVLGIPTILAKAGFKAVYLRPAPLAYQLRLGVTGHRHLADHNGVREAVDRLLAHIDATLTQAESTALEWAIVSPLARGADCLVARQVLRRPQAHLEVVTPFPLADYRKDYPNPNDRAELESLLAHPGTRQVTEIAGHYGDEAAEETRQQRQLAYLEVGRRVVDACEILIAIWDGEPAAGRGGSSDIVEYAACRGRVVLWINANQPAAPARWVRAEKPENHGEPHRLVFEALPQTTKQLSIGYHQLAAYNRDRTIPDTELAAALGGDVRELWLVADKAGLDASYLQMMIARLLPHYVKADRLALRYQARYQQSLQALHYLAAVAVSVVAFQVLLFPHELWLIGFEIACMAGAGGGLLYCRRQAWHEKWQHDRYLAEQLRTAKYGLLLARTTPHPQTQATVELPLYAGPKNWLVAAAAHIARHTAEGMTQAPDLAVLKRFLIDDWLRGQLRYHTKNAAKHLAHEAHGTQQGLLFFVAIVGLAVVHILGIGHTDHGPPVESFGTWVSFFAIILPAWAAAAHALHMHSEHERIATRSERMVEALTRIIDRCDAAPTLEELRQAISEAERLLGLESHEWAVMLSFRKPVLVV